MLALIIHECGHIVAAHAMGCKIERLYLQPLGSYLYLDQLIEVQPQTESRVSLAGPMANLLAVAVIMAVVRWSDQNYFIAYLIRANLMLMAYNLFPALPLDGGRVLRASLTGWYPYYRATRIVIVCGVVCGLTLLGLGAYGLIGGSLNPTIIAGGVFLLYNAYKEKKELLIPLIRYVLARQTSLQDAKFMTAHILVAVPGAKVNEIFKHIRPQKYYQVSVLDENFKITGTLTEHQLLREIMAGTGQRFLLDVVKAERKE